MGGSRSTRRRPTDGAGRIRQVGELWRRATESASKERPLLLLVDGLDESAQVAERTIPRLLPTTLAPYVHVICSSRPAPDPRKLVPVEHPFREARVQTLEPLDSADIGSLLLSLHVPSPQSLAVRIHEVTNGLPLFVRFVSADVAARGESALQAIEEQAPSGVRDYFAQQVEQIAALSKTDVAR